MSAPVVPLVFLSMDHPDYTTECRRFVEECLFVYAAPALEQWATAPGSGEAAELRRRWNASRLARLELAAAEIPDAAITAPAVDLIVERYWTEVFRWRQIRGLLDQCVGDEGRGLSEIERAYDLEGVASELADLQVLDVVAPDAAEGMVHVDEVLAELAGYLARMRDGTPTGDRAIPGDEIAEIVVARLFDVTADEVAAAVADYPGLVIDAGPGRTGP